MTGGRMPDSLNTVEMAALELGPEERARLAQRLLASLPRDSEVEAAWDDEIRRRVAALEAGSMETIPAAKVFVEARSRLKA
jgi:putative addiction module component (TIGR02574 family)